MEEKLEELSKAIDRAAVAEEGDTVDDFDADPGLERTLEILSKLGWSEKMEPAFSILAGTGDRDEPHGL